jgi:phenylacetate-CoA ligase
MIVKETLANLEAIRRDSFRRWGDYDSFITGSQIDNPFVKDYKNVQEKMFLDLINYVRKKVPEYKKINNINSLDDIIKLPILTKDELRRNGKEYLSEEVEEKKLYQGSTSGSTGKPLKFYRDKESVRFNYIFADKMNEVVGLTEEDVKCRFSGVNLFEFNKKKPPYWVYISRYKQLQCSSYHLKESNFKSFIDAMIHRKVTFGTGYAKTWLFLAQYVLKHNCEVPKLKAIVTDSEGITDDEQDLIEKAFDCKVYQTYGLGEVGQIAFQCSHRNYHIIPQTAYVEIVDENYRLVDTEKMGEIIVTSLYSKKTPYIRYATGDMGSLGSSPCKCGWTSPYIKDIAGRIDDYLLTHDGRKINRLSPIMKPAIGVKSSQLIQLDKSNLLIKIIPDTDFDEDSMEIVVSNAKDFLGNINVTWEIVSELERTKNGKIRFVLRKF